MDVFGFCSNLFGVVHNRACIKGELFLMQIVLIGGVIHMSGLLGLLSVPMAKFAEGAILAAAVFLASKDIKIR